MTASFPRRLLLLLALLATACASTSTPGPAGPVARTGPDDSDLWNLAPSGANAIADVDVAALGSSPWSSALVKGGVAEDREQRLKQFGYDVFADVDRLLSAAVGPAGPGEVLTVVRGRFDAQRVTAAFQASTPGATAARWRESTVLEGGGRAVALVTPRTLAHGTPESVRAAIDAAWGMVPDARGGPLGQLRRALDVEAAGSAVTLVLLVTDEVRARAAGFVEVPAGLRRLGVRVDLGHDLDATARAVLDDASQAAVATDVWGGALAELRRQRMLRALGLGPVVDGVKLKQRGAEVHAQLHIPEQRREALAERLLFLLQMIAKQRPQTAQP